MLGAGASRRRITHTLLTAYADGLLSEETFNYRIDQLLGARVIEPRRLIGDLMFRRAADWRIRWLRAASTVRRSLVPTRRLAPALNEIILALDWTGATGELIVGRHHRCDVVLKDLSVSRRHVRLVFRDGAWVVQDLESTNGTIVNGVRVGRCALRPGDQLALGDALLRVD
jgi:FHA domain